MSFIRPEVTDSLKRWREVLIWGVVTAVGLYVFVTGVASLAWLLIPAGLLLTLIGGAYSVSGLWRLRLGDADQAEGMVQVDEARVAYFGPLGGAFIDLDDLERVDITSRFWRLTSTDGTQVNIPRGAVGVEALPDAFSALPGFSLAGTAWQRSRAATRVLPTNVIPLRRPGPPDRPH